MKGRQIKYNRKELEFIETNSKLPRKDLHEMYCSKFKRDEILKILITIW